LIAGQSLGSAVPSVLLVGCGDIAQRLALLLQGSYRLTGLRRHPESLPSVITPLAVDLCDSRAVSAALAGRTFDYVVVTLTPGERSEARYRQIYVEGTRNLLAGLQGQPRIVWVSSTSVYAQDQGELVDESSPATGSGFSGRCLREAEDLVAASGFVATSVRFSGIYGPGRERLLRLLQEGLVDWAGAAQWSNRIHADDCARVLAFLIEKWQSGVALAPCYVASDNCPAQLGEVWQWLAHQTGVANPVEDDNWRAQPASGKRCVNNLLLREGFKFMYLDFREGYGSVLLQGLHK
jgi:nucleoside-diphosphate-sugar epimerase